MRSKSVVGPDSLVVTAETKFIHGLNWILTSIIVFIIVWLPWFCWFKHDICVEILEEGWHDVMKSVSIEVSSYKHMQIVIWQEYNYNYIVSLFPMLIGEKPTLCEIKYGAPCGFSGRFEDAKLSLKMKVEICSNLHWRLKMWENSIFFHVEEWRCEELNVLACWRTLLKMENAFLKKIWRALLNMWRKWRQPRVQGPPSIFISFQNKELFQL